MTPPDVELLDAARRLRALLEAKIDRRTRTFAGRGAILMGTDDTLDVLRCLDALLADGE